MRDPRYDILFEPVRIGPLTARNRFYQVPHCTGMGWALPRTLAAMRGMKAEGGWAVVNTEYCSIHPSSDDTPYPYARLWDREDVRAQGLMTEAVHRHGALAGCELWIGGNYIASLSSRQPPLDLISIPARGDPVQSRRLDKQDIRDIRRWHRDAARRACEAGFDIVYVYATHGYLLHHFLSRRQNPRSDEYGGSLENRDPSRPRDPGGDARGHRPRPRAGAALHRRAPSQRRCGARRICRDGGDARRGCPISGMSCPTITCWRWAARASCREGAIEPFVAYVRRVTGKPVVSVGRFTSPDAMVSQVKRGVLDLIGAARPSIADPFLPRKIEEGRMEEIRECIGCNICYASNTRGTPLRCTQNPTMGEEWRRGWHPERIAAKASEDAVLVVGGGPAGLEAARALGQRGYRVLLAEASRALGGRVSQESRLPGLAEWARVRDWRLGRLKTMSNVEIYLESRLDAAQVLDFGIPQVLIATGAHWRKDGIGRHHRRTIAGFDHEHVVTPDDVMADADALVARWPEGPIVIFDDDHYYMAAVIAEALVRRGRKVSLVTTAGTAAAWSAHTDEHLDTNRRLRELGVEIHTSRAAGAYDGERLAIDCVFTGKRDWLPAAGVVSVTAREPNDALYLALSEDSGGTCPRRHPVLAQDRRLRRAGAHCPCRLRRPSRGAGDGCGSECDPAADRAAER